jgi:hypothetical protein
MPEEYSVSILLRRFLVLTSCPPGWKGFDLYLLRDAETVFYVGQSDCAYERVWNHIRGGPHGHSIPGRFILANWPKSGSFQVELISSYAPRFASVGHNLDTAERALIAEWTPCFIVSLNAQPHAVPPGYILPNAPLKFVRSYTRMLREAEAAARMDANRAGWDGA